MCRYRISLALRCKGRHSAAAWPLRRAVEGRRGTSFGSLGVSAAPRSAPLEELHWQIFLAGLWVPSPPQPLPTDLPREVQPKPADKVASRCPSCGLNEPLFRRTARPRRAGRGWRARPSPPGSPEQSVSGRTWGPGRSELPPWSDGGPGLPALSGPGEADLTGWGGNPRPRRTGAAGARGPLRRGDWTPSPSSKSPFSPELCPDRGHALSLHPQPRRSRGHSWSALRACQREGT